MRPQFTRLLFLVLCCLAGGANAQPASPGTISPLSAATQPDRLAWWREARFGMFIHWGPVSLKETEISWSRANTNPKCPNQGEIPAVVYDSLYQQFNPTNFDAQQWVALARAAGMKYMVLTAKHCDGFLLWDSKVDPYNITHTPFKRDVCAELARAAHEQGMRIGWYFSPMDWRDPDCRNEHNERFVAKMQAELRELLSNYGRIDLLWFDCDGREIPWDQAKTYALVKELQPQIIINNRLDMGPGMDPGSAHSIGPQADYFTPEQWIGGYEDQH
jgi:alpha-L-fucosidase